MGELTDQSLSQFIEAIGSTEPSPGAGAAGAVALAMAAACLAKAFAISARHSASPDGLNLAADRARDLVRRALAGAQRDAQDFRALIKHAAAAPEANLRRDGETMLRLARELRRLAEDHAGAVIPIMGGDLAAAEALAEASDRIQGHNLGELGG